MTMEKTLLLVEDDVMVALAEARKLTRRGYRVLTAFSGGEAVETAKREPDIDLILMDIELGEGIDGTRSAELILAERDLPIVFLSGHVDADIVERTERITSYGYVVKNTGITILDASIKMAFKLHKAHREVQKIASDLAERELSLQKNRDLLNETGKMAKVGGWEFDVATMEQTWTDEVYRIHEVASDFRPTVEAGIAFYAPEAVPVISAAVRRAIGFGEPFDLELPFITARGNRRWVRAIGRTYQDNGKTVKVGGTFQDITDRKNAELQKDAALSELRERERMLGTLIGNLPGFVYRCANDQSWTMEFMSGGCFGITGYQPDDFIGNKRLTYNDIVHPDYREPLWNKWQELLARRETFEDEYPIIAAAGDTRWVWERGRGIFSDEGSLLFLEGFITDITDRKAAEEKYASAAREKQILHRELQHRVKNTLALITALVGLETGLSHDNAVTGVLERLKGRIHALAKLYALLYESDQSNTLRLDHYLGAVGDSIMDAYWQTGREIELAMRLDEVVVDANRASSLGIILNELLTNALKNAFLGESARTITLTLSTSGNDLVLTVANSGVENEVNETQGLSIELVKMLTNQLGGSVDYDDRNGSSYTVRVRRGE